MPNDNPGRDAPSTPEPDQNGKGGTHEPDWSSLPTWAQQEFQMLRNQLSTVNNESAGRRIEIDNLMKQVNALAQGQKKQLEEDGNFRKLSEQQAAEIAMLKPHQERAEALDKMIRESNTRRIEQVPENMRGMVPDDYAPEKLASWLDRNWANLTQKRAPDLDAGVGGGSGGRKTLPNLSDYEKKIARMSGMTDEQYVEFREKGQQTTLEKLQGE